MALTKVQIGMTDAPTSGTAVTASGTSVDFNSIPATAKRVTVMFSGVSTNGASNFQVQIGAGSFATTGYISTSSGSTSTVQSTTGFLVNSSLAAPTLVGGVITLVNISGNTWVESGTSSSGGGNFVCSTAGYVTLSSTLDRLRITTVNGTDTFDAGTINIMYE